jgi:hypothetical protein
VVSFGSQQERKYWDTLSCIIESTAFSNFLNTVVGIKTYYVPFPQYIQQVLLQYFSQYHKLHTCSEITHFFSLKSYKKGPSSARCSFFKLYSVQLLQFNSIHFIPFHKSIQKTSFMGCGDRHK